MADFGKIDTTPTTEYVPVVGLKQFFRDTSKQTFIEWGKAFLEDVRLSNESLVNMPLYVTRYVDGVRDAPFEAVKPGGEVRDTYQFHRAVVARALYLVFKYSPVDSGFYIANHAILVDGKQVPEVPNDLRSGQTVAITNTVPYARKVAAGQGSAPGNLALWNFEIGLFGVVADQLEKEFGKYYAIYMSFIAIAGSYVQPGRRSLKKPRNMMTRAARLREDSWPAIFIEL